jgi:diadenylate cyclase
MFIFFQHKFFKSSPQEILDAFLSVISTFKFTDVIDVVILTYVIYLLLKLIRETRAGQLVKGIMLLVAGYFISIALELKVVSYLLEKTLSMGVLAMIVLFQPELRRALEKAGRTKFGIRLFGLGQDNDEMKQRWNPAIEAICDSCVELSATFTGALIVVERQVRLGEQIETGTILNATPSKEVFGNIFYPKSPLHDGAVIIRGDRVYAASCVLPLTERQNIGKNLGTRHRAGVGLSEVSDAFVIIVSEETGAISVARNGTLRRFLDLKTLEKMLLDIYLPSGDDNESFFSRLLRGGKKHE